MHTLAQVMQTACDQLRIALHWLAGNAQVEFIVPMELFDEPFDELVPTKPYTNLGRKYRVVLRDYDRQFDALTQHDWRIRWQHARNPSRGIRWITCTEELTPDEFSAELEQHPETAVVALTRSPSSSSQVSDMLRVALDSGMPSSGLAPACLPGTHRGPGRGYLPRAAVPGGVQPAPLRLGDREAP